MKKCFECVCVNNEVLVNKAEVSEFDLHYKHLLKLRHKQIHSQFERLRGTGTTY